METIVDPGPADELFEIEIVVDRDGKTHRGTRFAIGLPLHSPFSIHFLPLAPGKGFPSCTLCSSA